MESPLKNCVLQHQPSHLIRNKHIDLKTDIIFARLWEATVAQITNDINKANEDQKVIY